MAEVNQIEKSLEQFNQQITQITQTFTQQFLQTLAAVMQYDENNDLVDVVLDGEEEKGYQNQLNMQQGGDSLVLETGDRKDREDDREEFQAKIDDPNPPVHQVRNESVDDMLLRQVDNSMVREFCANKKEIHIANKLFDKIPERRRYVASLNPDPPDDYDHRTPDGTIEQLDPTHLWLQRVELLKLGNAPEIRVADNVFVEMPRSVLNSGYTKIEGCVYVIIDQYPPKYNDSGGGTRISVNAMDGFSDDSAIYEVDFDIAVFTNLTRDHLDFHGYDEEYRDAKAKLFSKMIDPEQHQKVVNIDDPNADFFISQGNPNLPVVTFAMENKNAAIHPLKYELTLFETQVLVNTPQGILEISSGLLGRHNIYNILVAVAVGIVVETPLEDIVRGIEEVNAVPGRCELIDEEQAFGVIVDYAHTPDALSILLDYVRELGPKRIITVFGCAGESDRGKRPVMVKIATDKSDMTLLTLYNPKSEDPLDILDDMLAGVGWTMQDYLKHGKNDYYPSFPNCHRLFLHYIRRVAVHAVVDMGEEGEVVVVFGKGHETYQIEGDKKEFFDDREECREALQYVDELNSDHRKRVTTTVANNQNGHHVMHYCLTYLYNEDNILLLDNIAYNCSVEHSFSSGESRAFMMKLLFEDRIHGKMLKIVGTIQGLDGLTFHAKYFKTGNKFYKWHVVLKIGSNESSQLAINENAIGLSQYVIICQENGLVPVAELEILVDGPHDISKCAYERVLAILVVNKLRGVLTISALKIRVPRTLGPATFNPDEHDDFKKICCLVGIMKVIHWGLIRSTFLSLYVLHVVAFSSAVSKSLLKLEVKVIAMMPLESIMDLFRSNLVHRHALHIFAISNRLLAASTHASVKDNAWANEQLMVDCATDGQHTFNNPGQGKENGVHIGFLGVFGKKKVGCL